MVREYCYMVSVDGVEWEELWSSESMEELDGKYVSVCGGIVWREGERRGEEWYEDGVRYEIVYRK